MATRKPKIQRVELSNHVLPIHCPFCGKKALETEENWEKKVRLCKHVLFIAHDEGFAFRSRRFDAIMKIDGVANEEIKLGNHGYDGYTDRVPLNDAIKIASYVPAPSFFGAYIGFAPLDEA